MEEGALERFDQAQQAQQEAGKKAGSGALVASLVQQLSGALVYTDVGNAETNRRLWDRYAEAWGPKEEFVSTIAGHTARTAKQQEESEPSVLGEEWSSVADLEHVLARYLYPCLNPEARVAEIGVGGGRIARYVISRCTSLVCMDLSPQMLQRAQATLQDCAGAVLEFVLLDPQQPAAYPERLEGTLDVVYAFDVLVHVDLHTMFQVFKGARRLLKPGGKAFFSTANLLTPAGWRRFERQSKYTAAGFYFVCPDMVDRLLHQAGFRVLKSSSVPDGFKELNDADGAAWGNLYEGRDYLVVAEAVGDDV